MRVFIDTNVIISAALFPQGKVAEVVSHLIENHDLIISSYSINECETVFDRKFPLKKECLKKFFSNLTFELFETPNNIDSNAYPQIRDLKDIPIFVSAIVSNSDILITGDKDFENINSKKPLIFTPNAYFELLNKK